MSRVIDVASFVYHQPHDIICIIIEIQKQGSSRRIGLDAKMCQTGTIREDVSCRVMQGWAR